MLKPNKDFKSFSWSFETFLDFKYKINGIKIPKKRPRIIIRKLGKA